MKILIADAFDDSLPGRLAPFGEVTQDAAKAAEADVLLVRSKTKVTKEYLEGAPNLKLIIRGGVARGEVGVGLGREDRWQKFEEAGLDELRAEGESRTAFLLRYTLSHPHVHTIIVGTLYPDHLQENIDVAQKGPLPADVYAEAKRRLDQVGVRPVN